MKTKSSPHREIIEMKRSGKMIQKQEHSEEYSSTHAGTYRRTELEIKKKEEPLTILQDITFARVPYWFPNFHYKALKMNLVCPFHPEEGKKYPVIVWICGGAWITMEKSAHLPFWTELARKGYIIASVEYRMSSTKHFPAQLEDVKSAIRYLRAHAEEFHIDPERIVAAGESAGGHLAALAGVTGDRKEFDVGENLEMSSRVQAVLDFYGPADFLSHAAEENEEKPESEEKPEFLMGPSPVEMLLGYAPEKQPEKARLAAALSYVNPDTPPFYIIHGTADPVVPVEGSRNLAKKLEENGCSVRLVEINDAVHADPRIYQKETRDEIEAFLKRVFAEPALPFQEHVRMDRAIQEPFLTMLENVVFAQTPYWFPYYNYKDLDLDLLLPVWGKEGEKHPLLVWICGGAFLTMEKAAYLPWLMYFARAGYVIASVQYRLSNVAKFPAPLEDVKKAIRFLHAHAEEFHIDKTKTVVGGESAGGYLASMTGLTNDRKEYEVGEYPEESSHVDAVIDFYGPAALDSSTRVTETTPPFFMAHGTGDTLVDCKGSDEFYEELKKNGIPVEYFVVKDAPHMGMEFYQKEMADRILGFLDRNL